MQECLRNEGILSVCHNKIINPITNRLIQCRACKDHNAPISAKSKRAATKRAQDCRQAAHNLNKIINLDLRTEDSRLQQVLDELNEEKAAMLATIKSKLALHAILMRPCLSKTTLPPETTIKLPEVPEAPPRSPPPKKKKHSSQE